ncbi:hypothetical protein N7457_002906 [Penicillium paradoxum]|uniref:uncharacterized protein n=1 Tax=Penicillium paradoxum TaxID=176176 RepID=UPI00254967DE|nr:uncharacterized protein N7457_002906 [Penicillium paradoxum]KAJ5787916.1 hypothetical protein N7457_002906 [Penicillium paradoxum]
MKPPVDLIIPQLCAGLSRPEYRAAISLTADALLTSTENHRTGAVNDGVLNPQDICFGLSDIYVQLDHLIHSMCRANKATGSDEVMSLLIAMQSEPPFTAQLAVELKDVIRRGSLAS